MRYLALLTTLLLTSPVAHAQRPGAPARTPSTWLGLSGGMLLMGNVQDGTTGSSWDFSNAWPIRISLERSMGRGGSLGAQFTYARAPLRYSSSGPCSSCNAHATVATYGPLLRIGAGQTWHQVLELFAGVMQYGGFTEDGSELTLPPDSPNRDFAFSVGYGIGYPIGTDWELELMTSYLSAVHERTSLAGNVQTLAQHTTLMVGLRMGF